MQSAGWEPRHHRARCHRFGGSAVPGPVHRAGADGRRIAIAAQQERRTGNRGAVQQRTVQVRPECAAGVEQPRRVHVEQRGRVPDLVLERERSRAGEHAVPTHPEAAGALTGQPLETEEFTSQPPCPEAEHVDPEIQREVHAEPAAQVVLDGPGEVAQQQRYGNLAGRIDAAHRIVLADGVGPGGVGSGMLHQQGAVIAVVPARVLHQAVERIGAVEGAAVRVENPAAHMHIPVVHGAAIEARCAREVEQALPERITRDSAHALPRDDPNRCAGHVQREHGRQRVAGPAINPSQAREPVPEVGRHH